MNVVEVGAVVTVERQDCVVDHLMVRMFPSL